MKARINGRGVLLGTALAVLALPGCIGAPRVAYTDHVDFSRDGWEPGRCVVFDVGQADSMNTLDARYDAVLSLRYSKGCHLRELPLLLEQTALEGNFSASPDTLRLNVPLRDADGHPEGRSSYSFYEVTDTILRAISIPEGYSLTFYNTLDAASTRGLRSLTLTLYVNTN